jgi:hypothetical protein
MRSTTLRSVLVPAGFVTLAAGVVPGSAAAQRDFLFRAPVAALSVRVGPMLYSARGDVFDFITDNLTLERSDFRAPAVGAELILMPSSRLDVVLGFMWSKTEAKSEFLDWVEEVERDGVVVDSLPIEQVTRLRTVPLTATLRYLLLPRGRRVSQLAWLPRGTVPYVGAGGGITWYRFEQEGNFVDFEDLNVFGPTLLESSGQQATFHVLAGVDHWFMSRVGVNAEARYTYGSAKPNESFSSYDDLDLGGFQVTLGLSFRW